MKQKTNQIIESKNLLYPRCPRCLKPSIILCHSDYIKIECSCGCNDSLSLKQYSSFLKHQQKNEIVTKCPKHINNKYMFYCLDCELHLCDLCKAEKAHQSHSIEPLKTDLDVSSIKKCINETKTRFTNYIINIKDNLIEILENPIRLVKKIAEDRVKKNTQILEFYSNLVSSYESISNNFYFERNITNQKIFSTYNSYIDLSLFSYCETGKLLSNAHNYNYDFIDIKIINKDYLFIIGDDKLQLYSAIDCNLLDTFNNNGEIVSSEIIDDKIIISLSLNDNNSMLQLYEIKNNKCLYIQQSQQKIKRMLNYF